jgi:hypothetical protein
VEPDDTHADIPFEPVKEAPTPAVEWSDERLANADAHEGLDQMTSETVAGGGVTMIPSDELGVTYKGRTPSENPAWMQDIIATENVGRKDVLNAVKKAKAGKRLGARQKRIIKMMLDEWEAPLKYDSPEAAAMAGAVDVEAESFTDVFGAPSATEQEIADRDRKRAEKEKAAPAADTGALDDLFTSEQTQQQSRAQTDIEQQIKPRDVAPGELDALVEELDQQLTRFAEEGERNMGFDQTEIVGGVQKLKLHNDPRAAEYEARMQEVVFGEPAAVPDQIASITTASTADEVNAARQLIFSMPWGNPRSEATRQYESKFEGFKGETETVEFTSNKIKGGPNATAELNVGQITENAWGYGYNTAFMTGNYSGGATGIGPFSQAFSSQEEARRAGLEYLLRVFDYTNKPADGLISKAQVTAAKQISKEIQSELDAMGPGTAAPPDAETSVGAIVDELNEIQNAGIAREQAEAAPTPPPPGAPVYGEPLGFDDAGPDTEARVFQAIPPINPKKRVAIDTRLKREGNKFITPEQAEDRLNEWEANAIAQGKASREADRRPQNHKDNYNRVIISLFDTTGKWANPYALAGYDVRTMDIKQGIDVTDFSVEYLEETFGSFEGKEIYGIIAACPCTTFANSSTKWRRSDLPPDHPYNRHENQDPEWSRHWIREMWGDKAADAVDENGNPKYATPHDYAIDLVNKTIQTLEYLRPQFWAVENPEGRIEEAAGLPNPWRTGFQPHNFGDPYTKRTLLWGNFNDDLPTANVDPVEGSKMHMMSPSEERAAQRSETPEGFALAFFQANNYLDTDPVERTMKDYWYVAGAIQAAFKAGVTENEIRENVYLDIAYEPESASVEGAKETIRELIAGKGGPPTTPGTPPTTPAPEDIDTGPAERRAATMSGLAEIMSETEIDAAAAEADPDAATEAQKEAGNYKKGHLSIGGLDFAIENPAGTVRHGKLKLRDHYGYIKRTVGKDGDQVDVFINSKAQEDWAGDVYIVDQLDPESKNFDEHKVMFGYNNLIDARRAYKRNFNKDWKGAGAVTKMTLDEFKSWLAEPGANDKPAALSPVTEEGRKARAKENKDLRYSAGKDLLNAPTNEFVEKVLNPTGKSPYIEGDFPIHGDIPDTMPMNVAVSELLKLQEQREGAPAAPAKPSHEAIAAALKPVEESLPGAPVTLLHNYKQAPAPVVKAMQEQGMTQVKAVFDPQTAEIFLFTDQIGSIDEATRTSLHEKTHRGLRVAFGNRLDPLLDDIYKNANETRQANMQTIAEKYRLDPTVVEDQRVMAEELLTHIAEHDVSDGMVNRAVAFIRKILRDMGVNLETWTDNDIRALIREAQGSIGRRGNRVEGVMIEEEVIVEGTDEIYIVEQDADVVLTGVQNRIEICRKLRACL